MKRLVQLFHVETGTTPSTKVLDYWENGDIEWLTPADLNGLDSSVYIEGSERKVTRRALDETGLSLLPPKAIVLSTRAPVGYVGILRGQATFNQGCKGLVPRDWEQIDTEYYCQYLRFKRELLENASSGSTFKELSKDALERFEIIRPSIAEQQKVAAILGGIDEAIGATNRKIEKAIRMKEGLLRRLFARGIGHRKFQQTEMGSIPASWSVVQLAEVSEINREAKDPTVELAETTVAYIDIDSVGNGTGRIGEPKQILGKEAPLRARRVVHADDVIMSTVRPYLKAFAIIPREYDNQICSTGFAVLSAKPGMMPHYLLYALFTDLILSKCRKMMMGGQYPALNSTQVGELLIPLPPTTEEQDGIAAILRAADDKLGIEEERRARLQRIKRGLMNELLTGKKRVGGTDEIIR